MKAAIIIAVAWVGTLAGSFFYGDHVGAQRVEAKQLAVEVAIRETREAAQLGAAAAISKLKPVNTIIRGEVQREIQTNTIYRDCKLPAGGMQLANDALAGKRTKPAGGGELPGADAAGR